ncbi:MAG TPA: hypothetical protein VNJ02_04645 [Vicinamibacterales bacterium]|nr:hypothetical protein [Vicinamibacterales bacterium]
MKTIMSVIVLLLTGTLSALAQTRPVTVDDVLGLKTVSSPAVSPDGSQVLYTVRQWEPERDRMESRTRIWKVAVSGGPARQLTFGERGDSQPQWSPDGHYVSFVSARGTGTGEDAPRAQIYVMRADGGEAWKLTDLKEAVSSYSWSPDSKHIALVSNDTRSAADEEAIKKRDDERVFEGDFRYAHVSVVDVESKQLTRATTGSTYTVSGAPSWAADSSGFVFSAKPTSMIRDYRSDIYMARLAGNAVEQISANAGPDSNPQWSPDGNSIAWVSEPTTAKAIGDGTLPSYIGNGHLMIYDVAKKRCATFTTASSMSTPDRHSGALIAAAFSLSPANAPTPTRSRSMWRQAPTLSCRARRRCSTARAAPTAK